MENAIFELYVGYECGGPEDGMMVREGVGTLVGTMSLSDYIKQYGLNLADKVEAEYRKLYKDEADFIGCRFKRIIPEDEAKQLREMWAWEETHCIDGNVYV